MATATQAIIPAGTLVASGNNYVTITPRSNSAYWLIGASDSVAPVSDARHKFTAYKDTSMLLLAGEHLWVFGKRDLAVTITAA